MPQPLFDQHIDRTRFPSMKWNHTQIESFFGNPDAIPFWVADMDFAAPQVVIDSILARAKHGVYGYESKPNAYQDALLSWYAERQNWQIDPQTIESCPSVLNAVTVLINQHSDEGDGVITQSPVFFEFRQVIRSNKRKAVKNPLKFVDGHYQMDFDDLEQRAADPNNKIMILCNPHNPIGRVWTRDELTRVAEICQANDVLLISDEIHGDIIYAPHTFTPIATVAADVGTKFVACVSPGKTFNIVGMVDAFVVAPDEEIRAQFHDFAHRYQTNKNNVFALAAIEAAYSQGGAWVDDLLVYLQGNIDFMQSYLAENIPQVSLVDVEGTYLAWVNFSGLDMDAKALAKFLGEDAGIAVSPGHWFGREGAGFARWNIACPRSTLQEALSRLERAVSG